LSNLRELAAFAVSIRIGGAGIYDVNTLHQKSPPRG
jgi:hypothetical protein